MKIKTLNLLLIISIFTSFWTNIVFSDSLDNNFLRIRPVLEALNFQIEWDSNKYQAIVKKDNSIIILDYNEKKLLLRISKGTYN